MLSGVGIICFAASYAVVLVLEVSRLLFRSGIRRAVMLAFAWAGLLAHSAYLYHRAAQANLSPLSSEHDWYLIAAWVLMVVYLFLVHYYPRSAFGLFLVPLVLGLIGTATFFARSDPFPREPASKIWGIIHGTSILLAAVSVLIGFATGLMYLGQSRRLKNKQLPVPGLRLPSLEWLQRANSHAMAASAVLMAMGVASGMILNLTNTADEATHLPWSDPLIVSTAAMLGWLLVSLGVAALYKPARQGRKVAYFTVVSFVFLTIALSVGLFLRTQHGGRWKADGKDPRSEVREQTSRRIPGGPA